MFAGRTGPLTLPALALDPPLLRRLGIAGSHRAVVAIGADVDHVERFAGGRMNRATSHA